MLIDKQIEKIGVFLGKRIYKSLLKKFIEGKINKFKIQVSGLENIYKLKGQAFILASNHLLPHDGGLLKTGVSPDSFVIKEIIFSQIQKETALAVNYLLEIPVLKRILEQFTKGFIIGLDSIPVGRGHDSFHNVFLKAVEKTAQQKRPILIYPVGAQHEDFEQTHEIKAGAGYIALKYNLPIVPVYIKGAYEWNKLNQKIYLFFGEPFSPQNLTVDQISEKIKKEILKLKSDIISSKSLL